MAPFKGSGDRRVGGGRHTMELKLVAVFASVLLLASGAAMAIPGIVEFESVCTVGRT